MLSSLLKYCNYFIFSGEMKLSFIGSKNSHVTAVRYGSYPMLSYVIRITSLCSYHVNYVCRKLECCEVKEHGVFGIRKAHV